MFYIYVYTFDFYLFIVFLPLDYKSLMARTLCNLLTTISQGKKLFIGSRYPFSSKHLDFLVSLEVGVTTLPSSGQWDVSRNDVYNF